MTKNSFSSSDLNALPNSALAHIFEDAFKDFKSKPASSASISSSFLDDLGESLYNETISSEVASKMNSEPTRSKIIKNAKSRASAVNAFNDLFNLATKSSSASKSPNHTDKGGSLNKASSLANLLLNDEPKSKSTNHAPAGLENGNAHKNTGNPFESFLLDNFCNNLERAMEYNRINDRRFDKACEDGPKLTVEAEQTRLYSDDSIEIRDISIMRAEEDVVLLHKFGFSSKSQNRELMKILVSLYNNKHVNVPSEYLGGLLLTMPELEKLRKYVPDLFDLTIKELESGWKTSINLSKKRKQLTLNNPQVFKMTAEEQIKWYDHDARLPKNNIYQAKVVKAEEALTLLRKLGAIPDSLYQEYVGALGRIYMGTVYTSVHGVIYELSHARDRFIQEKLSK